MIRALLVTGLSALMLGSALADENVEMQTDTAEGVPVEMLVRLRDNILLYDDVYFAWNRRHLFGDKSSLWDIEGKKDEEYMKSIRKQKELKISVTGGKMKIEHVPENVEQPEEQKIAKRSAECCGPGTQPLRMILADAITNDQEFSNAEWREKRGAGWPGPRPLRMILSENLVDEGEKMDVEKRSAGWPGPRPLRMILSENVVDEGEKMDVEKRSAGWPGPRPLRMILSENVVDEDEKMDVEKRSAGWPGPRPLRMILSENVVDEGEKMDVEKRSAGWPGPRPLRMILSENVVDEGEKMDVEKRSAGWPGPRPLRMILSENVVDEGEKMDVEKRSAGWPGPRPLRMILSESMVDEGEKMDVEKRSAGWPGPKPLRMILSENVVDEGEELDVEKRSAERRPISGGKMKVDDVPDIAKRSVDAGDESEQVDINKRSAECCRPGTRPLRMILSDAITDDQEFSNAEWREKRGAGWPGPRPLRMILSENLVDEGEKIDVKKRNAGWPGPRPLRMILSENVVDEGEKMDVNKRSAGWPGPRPLRMILSENMVNEKMDVEKRSAGWPGPRPLRMILSENVVDEGEKMDVEKRSAGWPGPRPLRMILSENVVDEGEKMNVEKRSAGWPGPRPLRMILSENVVDEGEKMDVEKRSAGWPGPRPLRMILSENMVDEGEKMDVEKRTAGWPGPRPLRMILSENVADEGDELDVEKRSAERRSISGGKMKVDDLPDIAKRSVDAEGENEKVDINKRSAECCRPGTRPLRMILSDAITDDQEFSNAEWREKRGAGWPGPRPLRMILSENLVDEGEKIDVEKRNAGWPGPRPLRMILSENVVDEDKEVNLEKRSAAKRQITGGKMKVDDVPELKAKTKTRERRHSVPQGPAADFIDIRKKETVVDVKIADSMTKDTSENKDRFDWPQQDDKQKADDAELVQEWFEAARSLAPFVPDSYTHLFENWQTIIQLFPGDSKLRYQFTRLFPVMKIRDAIKTSSQDDVFQHIFWPFNYKIGFLNQQLALLGFNGKIVSKEQQKLAFYEALEQYQNIKIRPAADHVTYSYNNPDIVDGLNRSGLIEFSKEFVESGGHLATEEEVETMVVKVSEALKLIGQTTPELFRAINQLVGTFAFYKAERPGYIGGTVSSALGIIWLDPGAMKDLSVAFFAEQIVHEYIHTALFYAELVHGTYTDHTQLSNARVISSIRKQLRDYDKSFHAAYVSMGIIAFHSQAGHWNRAENLATSLLPTVEDLIVVDQRTNILDNSGKAMLQALIDYLTVCRLWN